MEKQTLPNSTLILILGILSIVGIFCCAGIGGLILAIVAIVMANKATRKYNENPELYKGESNVKTGKILAWISVALFVLFLIWTAISIAQHGGIEGLEEQYRQIMEEAQRQQEAQQQAAEQNQ